VISAFPDLANQVLLQVEVSSAVSGVDKEKLLPYPENIHQSVEASPLEGLPNKSAL
jgi:hypothetical protein